MGLRDLAKKVLGRAQPARPEAAAPPVKAEAAARPETKGEATEKPWYLEGQGDIDGWDETNPGEEPGKKNLRK